MKEKGILDALDFIPEPFYYKDDDREVYVILCFFCNPNFWDTTLAEASANLVLQEHLFQYHTRPQEGKDGTHSTPEA